MRIHPKLSVLTPQERWIAMRIAEGVDKHAIAEERGISIKTFDTHRSKIMAKLKLDGNVQLTRLAIAVGFVPLPTYADAA